MSASASQTVDIALRVNGTDCEVRTEARRSLAYVLREDLGLTGTHLGCEHGICGACTVLIDGAAARACLLLGAQADGREVTTVESLESDQLDRLRSCFSENHALQCGFCTPGFLMLIVGAIADKEISTDEEILDVVGSNLCRCTGYTSIVAAVRQFLARPGAG